MTWRVNRFVAPGAATAVALLASVIGDVSRSSLHYPRIRVRGETDAREVVVREMNAIVGEDDSERIHCLIVVGKAPDRKTSVYRPRRGRPVKDAAAEGLTVAGEKGM